MRKAVKNLSLVMLFVMLAAFLPLRGNKALTAYADGDFTIEDGVLTAYTGSASEVVIPDGVTAIGEKAFYENKTVTAVTLPEGVRIIGDDAFEYCGYLKSVTLPASLRVIGDEAFCYAGLTTVTLPASLVEIGAYAFAYTDLAEVTLPAGVTELGRMPFYRCNSLTAVNVDSENPSFRSVDGVLFNRDMTTLYLYPRLRTGEVYEIPETVGVLGEDAFYDAKNLRKVTLSPRLHWDGGYAFGGCENLRTVVIPEGVTWIGTCMFCRCKNVTRLTFPSTVNTICHCAMQNMEGLTDLYLLCESPDVYRKAFKDVNETVTIHYAGTKEAWDAIPIYDGDWELVEGVTLSDILPASATVEYGWSPFTVENGVLTRYEGTTASHVTVPDGVTALGSQVFYGHDEIVSVTLPDSLTTIRGGAFFNCPNLTTVTMPDSVTEIYRNAFAYCPKLTGLKLPSSLTTLGDSAFQGCGSLKSLTIPEGVTELQSGTFAGCSGLTEITVPGSVKSIAYGAFEGCSGLKKIVLKDGVTTVNDLAFTGCSALTSVNIPSSVTVMGSSLFSGCESLRTLVIPDSVTSLGGDLFYNCPALSDIYYGGTREQWTTLAAYAGVGENVAVHCGELSPLAITQQPKDATGAVNEKVTFSVVATGSGVKYQWYYMKADASTWTAWKNGTSDTLTAPVYNSWNNAKFYCKLTDLTGATLNSGSAKMLVGTPLAITAQPTDATGAVNEKVTFKLKATGTGVKYQWYYKKASDSAWTAWKNGTSASLTATVYNSWNGAKFYCKLTDSSGKTLNSGSAKMIVGTPLAITGQPKDATGAVNEKVTFTVKATGSGISYKWYYKKADASTWTEWKNGTSSTLTATVYNSWNGAKFYCKLTDSSGKTLNSGSAKMIVGAAPLAITTQPTDASGAVNEKVTFTVAATGTGISYKWYYKKADASTWTEWKNGTSATLTATVYASWNGTKFYCKLTDASGKTLNSNSVKMYVATKITQQPKDATGAVNDKVTFTVKATGAGLSYKWYYKKASDSSWTEWKNGTSATLTATVYNSWNGAKFYCRITDANGKTVNSGSAKMIVG